MRDIRNGEIPSSYQEYSYRLTIILLYARSLVKAKMFVCVDKDTQSLERMRQCSCEML